MRRKRQNANRSGRQRDSERAATCSEQCVLSRLSLLYSLSVHVSYSSTTCLVACFLYALFPRELALQLFCTKTCRALLLTASPRGPSAARVDTPLEGWRPWNCAASQTGRGLAREFLAGAESGAPRVSVSVGLGRSGGSRVNTNWNLLVLHKTWTSKSMPHVHISMLYFGALFPRELALQLFCWARYESLVFSGVFTGEEVPRE